MVRMIYSFEGKTPRIHPSVFIADEATIIGDVSIGEDANIWPGVVIRGDVARSTLATASTSKTAPCCTWTRTVKRCWKTT